MLKFALPFLLLCTAAQAATPQLEDASITGTGGTLTITRLPIKTANGIIYRDVTIQLRADENGDVSFARGKTLEAVRTPGSGTPRSVEPGLTEIQPLVQVPSKPPRVQHFRAGSYRSGDGSFVTVTAGDQRLGVPSWTLTASGHAPLVSATWYEGLVSDNPEHRKIVRAGITSLDYSYGKSDDGDDPAFAANALIGATQQTDVLTIVSYHHGCCTNGTKAVSSISYTYAGR